MSNGNQTPAVVTSSSAVNALPAHLQEFAPQTSQDLEMLMQYTRPPRWRIVQGQSKGEIKAKFWAGDSISMPAMELIAPVLKDAAGKPSIAKAGAGTAVNVFPLFFFPEWICWNPTAVRDSLPTIRDRTTTLQSALAQKARNPAIRNAEICPECPKDSEGKPLYLSYCEHLNFLFMLENHELFGTPVVYSFSRSEHKAGTALATLISLRKTPAYFLARFQASVGYRTNSKGEWYGLDVVNPPAVANGVGPWAETPEMAAYLKDWNEKLSAAFHAGAMQTEYDETNEEPGATVISSSVAAGSEY